MTALHIVLGSDAVVGHALLLQGIHRICLLQERIPDVLLIPECIGVDTMCAVGASVGANGCIMGAPMGAF